MSYSASAGRRRSIASGPFLVAFTAPLNLVGEAVYGAADAAARLIGQTVRVVQVKARKQQTIKALSELDDRVLKDIGVNRSDIRYLARVLAEKPDAEHRAMRR